MYRLGFIGFGKMAQAIWSGLSQSKVYAAKEVCFVEKDSDLASLIEQKYGVHRVSLDTALTHAETVLLAIKPQNLRDVFSEPVAQAKGALVISILAGIDLQTLQYLFPKAACVRAMPNTPALVGASMSALSFSEGCTPAQKKTAMHVFQALGETVVVPETLMDLVTGMSGSGPAFFYQLAIYLRDYARTQGMSDKEAILLVAQTMIGAGKMLKETATEPEALIQAVSSPNGTTVAGLEVMNNSAIQQDLVNVIKRAQERSKELREGH